MQLSSQKASANNGFALVVALSLMAFILVLLLSITTLVRVETSASNTQVSSLKAKQNALLALNVAIGELQAATGPDQRVTSRADVLDTNPGTVENDGVANPFWLGAYKTVQPGKETQSMEALRAWSTDRDASDRVDWLVSSRSELDGSVDPVRTDVVTLNGGSASNVVTLATYDDNSGLSVPVQAGKLDVLANSGAVDGRYSWWVADESAKFKINATKEDTVLDDQPFEPQWSLMAPQQSNPSIIPELSSFDVNNTEQRERLELALTNDSLPLVDPAWAEWIKDNADDFTVASQSIPVDVTQGRLKEDLSVYLETDASGLEDSDNIIRGSGDEKANHYEGRLSTLSSSLDYDDDKLPKFGMIKSWYETGSDLSGFAGGTPRDPRPHTDEEHGLHPVIMRGSVNYGLSFRVSGEGFIPVFLIYPKFVLWNPHNAPIAPAKYVVQVRVDASQLITHIASRGKLWAAYNKTQDYYYLGDFKNSIHTWSRFTWNRTSSQSLARNPNDSRYQTDSDDTYTYLTFVIDNEGFAPGESLYYTASDKSDSSNINSNAYINEDISFFETNFSDGDFEDHNLLINEEEGVFGYFHHSAERPNSPEPGSSSPPPVTPRNTLETDVLRAALIFQDDKGSDTHPADRGMSTKLYTVSDLGDIELLQFLDFSDDVDPDHAIDWESRDGEGHSRDPRLHYSYVDFQSISSITQGGSIPDFIRGHGFAITPIGTGITETAESGVNLSRKRLFARNNLAVREINLEDPLLSSPGPSAIYSETKHTKDEFDSADGFPAGFPSLDGEYGDVTVDGYDTLGGYGLHANKFSDVTPGNTVYPLYDYPRSETGLLSLGFLKNVNFSQFHWQPSFPFGNSEAHTHVDREAYGESHGGESYTDLSYLLNESLWDRFFVSSIPQTGSSITEGTVLPNGRNRLVASADGTFPSDSDLRASITGFEKVAANVVVDGGFNVNSTSVDAWRMFLASHLGESVLSADGNRSNDISNAPLTVRAYPILTETGSVDQASPQTWSAIRSLSTDEIDLLAEAIVEEVKLRGPFLSMADFVNRRLVPNASNADQDYLGLKGTLQASIDKLSTSSTGSSINSDFYKGDAEITASTAPPNTRYPEHELGKPDGESGSTMFGVPGFLTQADLLAGLGSQMTVRGDTFTIRAYGESLSGITGSVESKVWCEAVVQRIAEPVEIGDSIVNPTGKFGRQYKLVSVRWLNEGEIL